MSVKNTISKKPKYPSKFTGQDSYEENELLGIEHIIGEIQTFMDVSLASTKEKPQFKGDIKLVHHSDKKNWQSRAHHF